MNTILFPNYLKNKISFCVNGQDNYIEIKNLNITDRGNINITIKGNQNKIIIKENCIINNILNIVIAPVVINGGGDCCSIEIGSDNFFNGVVSMICGEKNTSILIGNNGLYSSFSIRTSDNHPIYDIYSNRRLNMPGDIIIGDHCWVCDDVLILNNSFISSDCVIAARSLVTSLRTNKNSLIAGIPAKVKREGVYWKKDL
ncbi:TPA: hypothetical protein R5A97_001696 [Campylobacter jejuni]|nr:hypothetical protein [Campylobacter jejuni]